MLGRGPGGGIGSGMGYTLGNLGLGGTSRGVAKQVAKGARHGHDANDSECIYWMGDFAGVNLRARCPLCSGAQR